MLEAPVDPSRGWPEYLRAIRRLARLRRLSSGDWSALWTLLTGSAGDWLDSWFENDLLKAGLGFDSIVGHFASPYARGTGYLMLHHGLGDLRCLDGSWGHAVGGMGAITDALAAAARMHGVRIVCSSRVEKIIARAGGFDVHADGREYRARVVAGGVHPRTLFTELVDAACLPEAFLRRIRAWRSESGSFRANLALSELPDFACLPGRTPMPHHGSGILIATSLGYLEDAYRDALVEGTSRRPVIELLIPSTIDATLARAGTHVASVFCQHFRFELPDGQTWGSNRERMLARIIDTIDMFAPNFRRSVIGAKAYSPVDLEQRFGLVGGDIFHGALDLDQLYWARPAWGSAQYRSPVPGLYLCASGAHPGGGVTGMPGRNAARAIIFDFRRKGRGLRSLISR